MGLRHEHKTGFEMEYPMTINLGSGNISSPRVSNRWVEYCRRQRLFLSVKLGRLINEQLR